MNRTSTGVLTLAILVSMVATPSFRSGSNRGGAAVHSGKQEDANKIRESHSRKGTSKSSSCRHDDSFKGQLMEAIALAYSTISNKTASAGECFQDFTIPENVKTYVMFAFVADPRHTNLALFFDRQLEALQQGIQDGGQAGQWTFDRALMSWDNKEHPEFADFPSRALEQASEDEAEKEPGLLIFRRQADRLLVFVVGESPTGGIHKVQFWKTTELVGKLFGGRTPPVLGIFGPTFSGSLQSLSELLQCSSANKTFLCGGPRIIDFSGTVTSQSAVARFKKDNPKIAFATLQEYDDCSIARFLNFAVEKRYRPHEIAVLSEDESAYGSGGFSKTSGESSRPGSAEQPDEEVCLNETSESEMIRLYFPREISQLRNAYQHNLPDASPADKTPRTTLPLDLESTGSNDDTVPEFSHKQLPLSQEAVLLGIASELRHHRIKLVILRASDSLDQLFLARYLRGAYPQGRIVILGSDLLFRREIQDSRLHGIMALSTYSLTAAADHEFQGEGNHVDRVFPSSDAVGTYNATKLLAATLDAPSRQLCAAGTLSKCLPEVHLFEYHRPSSAGKDCPRSIPPVHLTVLGHEGFADVAVLCAQARSQNQTQARDLPNAAFLQTSLLPVEDPQQPNSGTTANSPETLELLVNGWRLFWILAILVALGYCYFILSASVLSSSEAVAHLAPPQADSRIWLFAITAYLHFVLLLMVLWPYLNIFKQAGVEKWSGMVVVAVVGLVGAGDLYRRRSPWIAGALLGACALSFLWLLRFRPSGLDDSEYMFVVRAVQLTSGVSPLLPVLLLLGAGLWGAWHSLSSSSLVDGRRPALPTRAHIPRDNAKNSQMLSRSESILEDDNQHLLKLLRPDSVEGRAVAASLFMLAAIWWYAEFRPLQTLESTGYEYLLAGIITFIAVFMLSGILRLQSIWAELRRLLVALDSLPLRRGFKRLEGFSWSPMWRVGAGSLTELRRILCRQFESWRCLINLAVPEIENISGEFLKRAGAVRAAYAQAKDNYSGGQRPSGSAPQISAASQDVQVLPVLVGHAGPGALPAFEATPTVILAGAETGVRQTRLPWLKAPWKWVRKVFRQGKLDTALIAQFCALQREFAKAGSYALTFTASQWDEATSVASNGVEEEGSGKIAEALQKLRQTPAEKAQALQEEKRSAQLHACEEFVALLYTAFILVALVRIRGLIVAVGGMYVLLLAALTVYPFQPQVVIRTGLMALLVVIVGIVGFVYAQMHRDSTLSYITGTEPGELGVNFWIRIGSFVALPAFSLVASQFPEIGNLFSSWVEPAVKALN